MCIYFWVCAYKKTMYHVFSSVLPSSQQQKRNRQNFVLFLIFADPAAKGEESRIEGTFVFFEPGSSRSYEPPKPWKIEVLAT